MSEQHDTPVTFSRAEMHDIRNAFDQGQETQCPHCKTPLSMSGPVAGGGTQGPVWYVKCDECHRAAFLTEAPGTRKPRSSS